MNLGLASMESSGRSHNYVGLAHKCSELGAGTTSQGLNETRVLRCIIKGTIVIPGIIRQSRKQLGHQCKRRVNGTV